MSDASFVGVRIQGGLLPADLPSQLATGNDPSGVTLSPKDYHLAAGETVRDAANRVWAYLRGAWTGYRDALAQLPHDASTTGLTRERFLLVLFDQLGYGRVPTTGRGGITVDGQPFPVSHVWQSVPIHLLGWGTALDTRTKGVAGAAGSSPQSMVQELLNRSDEHLWAFLSNGQVLRLLRDSTSLVGSAYVEFDLEAIFDGDLFADFLLLYTMCQVSRVETRDDEIGPASCRIEQWRTEAVENGSRALNLLRDGVVDALRTLGRGFLTHPANGELRQDLSDGRISVSDVNHALLRVAYRLLFTFVTEDRGALLDPTADPSARRRYAEFFSTERLRRAARRRRGGRYGDRWKALTLVWHGLGSETGLPELGVPGIGGLFDAGELDFLTECELSNDALMSAVRSLSLVREPKSGVLRVVDYRNLGAEELGSIYEALLEFVPQWDPATKTYTLNVASGNQRKDTGSYYTPTSLVESLLNTALDPVLDDAVKSTNDSEGQIQALLATTVCDPACGSGHFLVGAARRIAKRVAAIRTGDPEPAPDQVRAAMREVVAQCIYGVDVNPLAAELAKLSLWMEAIEPGRPLAYLDAQIKVGNTLMGATPALLAEGLPDAALKPIEGDLKTIATEVTRANRAERKGQGGLFDLSEAIAANTGLAKTVEQVVGTKALSLADIHVQRKRLKSFTDSEEYRQARLAADAWCAAFVWPLQLDAARPITHSTISALCNGINALDNGQTAELERLAAEYRFFHWHLEFPHIFRISTTDEALDSTSHGWTGGFSVVIGNPPWEQVEIDETEYFSTLSTEISEEKRATQRKKLISKLLVENDHINTRYQHDKRHVAAAAHFLKQSGAYPLSVSRRLNTYRLFAERFSQIVGHRGACGIITPTGLATEPSAANFRKDLIRSSRLQSVFDFVNTRRTYLYEPRFFVAVPSHYRFALTTFGGAGRNHAQILVATQLNDPSQTALATLPLEPHVVERLSSETFAVPLFASHSDATITVRAYKSSIIFSETGLHTRQGFINLSSDHSELRTFEQLTESGAKLVNDQFVTDSELFFPVQEGKLFGAYDNYRSTFAGVPLSRRFNKKAVPAPRRSGEWPIPRYWAPSELVNRKWPSSRSWILTGKEMMNDLTSPRTSIFCIQPKSAVAYTCQNIIGDKLPRQALLHYLACLNSIPFDYFVRQKKVGAHLTADILNQLPLPSPDTPFLGAAASEFTAPRAAAISARSPLASSYSEAWEGQAGEELDHRDATSLRAELDAAFLILYGIEREEIENVFSAFPVLKRTEEKSYGEFRSLQRTIEVYENLIQKFDDSPRGRGA
ncbi:N-6 DNA methylase [Rhodococcus sp. GA1]|uniref:Eco57I restriction-modification methylase domain-containing protein n=1 Tax=Rhodococcus sp. GA1 TaxID=2942275 RepID=UPI0020CD644A|nr:N-6 DNA methylase [Rhodococcus sp. GA1]